MNEVRSNVCLEVHTQPKDAMKGLHSFLHKEKTIVYFETIAVLIRVFKCLQWIRPDLRGRLGLYFSTLDEQYKRTTMKKFVDGDILILLATEAAGMGVDIQDVVQVIQYGFPRDMTSLVQRFGRAARRNDINGRAILYAPPVSQKAAASNAQVRQYLMDHHSKKCLWRFIDDLFGNETR
ncbi:ATP-dependent DNA helicase sgs1, partial [Podila horticola]